MEDLRYLLRLDSRACEASVSPSSSVDFLSSSISSFIASTRTGLKGDFSVRVAMLFFEDFSGEGKIAVGILLKGVLLLVRGASEQLS